MDDIIKAERKLAGLCVTCGNDKLFPDDACGTCMDRILTEMRTEMLSKRLDFETKKKKNGYTR